MPSPSLKHDCPHCGAENQGFEFRSGYTDPRKNQFWTYGDNKIKFPHIDHLTFSCGRCFTPVSVTIGRHVSDDPKAHALALSADFNDGNFDVLSIKPTKQKTDEAPETTPTQVATSFEQACRSLSREDLDLAGMGFRKALDVGTRHLIREMKPTDLDKVLAKSLYGRIEWLHSQQRLTNELKDWAHIIREEGNEAAHNETPYSKESAAELHDFTKVFLMYVFTIPSLIKAKRKTP